MLNDFTHRPGQDRGDVVSVIACVRLPATLIGRAQSVTATHHQPSSAAEHIGQRPYLTASNLRFQPIPLMGQEAQVWGVVTHVVHALGGGRP